MKYNQNIIGIFCSVACQVLFGFSYLFTKNITNTVSPMVLLSWRFVAAFLILTVCAGTRIIRLDFKGKPVRALFWVALFQPVFYFTGETLGIKLTSASESSVIIACIPIVTLLMTAVVLKVTPAKSQVLGVIITTAGIAAIVLMKGQEATFNPAGYLMLLMAVVSYSLYAIFSRKAVEFSSLEKTYAMVGLGAVTFTLIALAESAASGTLASNLALPFTNLDFLVAVLYLGLGCSVFAFFLYNKAIETIGVNRPASFVGVGTVVSVAAGVIILKESFSLYQCIGTVLVIGGVYLANLNREGQSFGLRSSWEGTDTSRA